MFALGFAHAEDRLWQMFFSYKIGAGELAEVSNS
jgi:acyl-homoserine lactone acylase PvdQ